MMDFLTSRLIFDLCRKFSFFWSLAVTQSLFFSENDNA